MPRVRDFKRDRLRDSAERPAKPAGQESQALSDAGSDPFMEGSQEGGDATRTRIPIMRYGTWGDTVYPGEWHTSDPKAPKVNKIL